MKNRLIILALLLFVAFISWKTYQFQQNKEKLPSRKSLISSNLEARLQVYADRVMGRCQDDLLKVAKEQADSIVFIKANELMLFDSIQRPVKPIKPDLPEKKEMKDSLEIAPLVKF